LVGRWPPRLLLQWWQAPRRLSRTYCPPSSAGTMWSTTSLAPVQPSSSRVQWGSRARTCWRMRSRSVLELGLVRVVGDRLSLPRGSWSGQCRWRGCRGLKGRPHLVQERRIWPMQADVRMGERPVLGLFDSGPLVALCCAMYHTGVLVTRAAGSCSACATAARVGGWGQRLGRRGVRLLARRVGWRRARGGLWVVAVRAKAWVHVGRCSGYEPRHCPRCADHPRCALRASARA
jgi:hypothetical protein